VSERLEGTTQVDTLLGSHLIEQQPPKKQVVQFQHQLPEHYWRQLVSVKGTISEKTRNKVAIIYTLLRGHPGAPVSVSSKVPQGFCPTIDLELFNLHYPKLSLDFVEHTTE